MSSRSSLRRWVGYIATMVILAIVGIKHINPGFTHLTPSAKTYTTAPNQRAIIKLPDGTKVKLSVATHLTVPPDFGKNSRTLILDGEAQFTVQHNAKRPFIVQTNSAVVRDLATSFNVRAYSGAGVAGVTSVTVRDGRVAVHSSQGTAATAAVVEPGQRAVISIDGKTHVSAVGNMNDDFAWSSGRLVINDLPVAEALALLSRWYGVEFRVADTVLFARHLSTVATESLTTEQLQTIAAVLDARATRTGHVVTLYLLSNPIQENL